MNKEDIKKLLRDEDEKKFVIIFNKDYDKEYEEIEDIFKKEKILVIYKNKEIATMVLAGPPGKIAEECIKLLDKNFEFVLYMLNKYGMRR